MNNAKDQFIKAIKACGITPPETIEAGGKLHRFASNGKRGDDSGWYIFHDGNHLAGAFGCWRSGITETWKADIGRAYTAEEKAAFKKRIAEDRAQAEAARKAEQESARGRAATLWQASGEASTEHHYLKAKGVLPYGVRQMGDKLIIPMREGKTLHSLQTIMPDGEKRFHKGGKVDGCYLAIDGNDDAPLCIVEGYATGASIHQATGYPVCIAFNAGNLLPVAKTMRGLFPDRQIILCADDDYQTKDKDGKPFNTGILKATEAAKAINGHLAVPDFGENRQEGATDFNDLHQSKGLEAVKQSIEAAVLPEEPQQDYGKIDEKEGREKGEVDEKESLEAAVKRQQNILAYEDGHFQKAKEGIFYITKDSNNNEKRLFICSPLEVIADTRDESSNEWGRLLEWKDRDGKTHRWAMPLEILKENGAEMRGELLRQGVNISTSQKARNLLSAYIQIWPVEKKALCVDRLGWHGDVYVLPEAAIGETGEAVVFQNNGYLEPALSEKGTLEEWKENIASLAAGNSRMVFAISCAFAPALADIVRIESGGFQLRGASSTGKSTAAHLAASVFGNPSKYKRQWRTTANGLEGLAAMHNDGLLILDELSQADPKEAGEAAYMLANGQGKTRATRNGTARKAASWRLMFLSSGEETLAQMMNSAGKKANAGQEIRLADINIDAGKNMGGFEVLHEMESPADLSKKLNESAHIYFGTAGKAWIEKIVSKRGDISDGLKNQIDQTTKEYATDKASGQVTRVARRFAFVAVAGELATLFDLTGWERGEADQATKKCFNAWLEDFGGNGNKEERSIIEQVRGFIEQHGASRFEDMKATEEQRIFNRAGFFRYNKEGEKEYLVLTKPYSNELCAGYDTKTVSNVLIKHGCLKAGYGGKSQVPERIPSLGKVVKVYVITSAIFD